MTLRKLSVCAGGAIALLAFSAASEAAPVSGAAGRLSADISAGSGIEKAAYRRCWWRHGYRVCRWVGYRDYDDYGYYGYGPYYSYGPGFGFRFGGGHGHFHRGHR